MTGGTEFRPPSPSSPLSWLRRAWSGLADNSARPTSHVVRDGATTSLGKAHQKSLEDRPGTTGVHLLRHGRDAFVARAVLARKAERSIDLQYYMFHQDTVGRLLLVELLGAADRNVRVRMLIDDMYGEEADGVWAALDRHPNIEVRLFNPFARGRSKFMQYVTRLRTINHRMHSKTYTVDDQVTVVGGRNIGSEYFDADPDLSFADLDVMAIGPVVAEVSTEFDEYWNSKHAYPISTLRLAATQDDLNQLRADLEIFRAQNSTSVYIDACSQSELAVALNNHTVKFNWSKAKIIHDSSEKQTLSKEQGQKQLLMSQLAPYLLEVKEELIIVSPYFVPGKRAVEAMCELSGQGVRVRILTNSLASNDVAAVHAGYSKFRKALLRGGVELFELDEAIKQTQAKRFTWLPGMSKSSLHAKTMALDHHAMFVGSFNFDQRSLYINNGDRHHF